MELITGIYFIIGTIIGIVLGYAIVSYIKESIAFNKMWKKSGLTIVILLIGLSSQAQLRQPQPKYNSRPLIERQKTQEKRVITMIAVNLAIFAVQEYALHTNNKQLRQSCTAAYFGVNAVGATWVLSSSTITDNRRFKTRFKENNKWSYR